MSYWLREMARKRRNGRERPMIQKVLKFENVAEMAGYLPDYNGKLNLPATQEAADRLAKAAGDIFAGWEPGDEKVAVTLTGLGPVWGYLAVAHALHGRAVRLTYAVLNVVTIVIWSHGS